MPTFDKTIKQKNEILRKVERKANIFYEEAISKQEDKNLEKFLAKELNSIK